MLSTNALTGTLPEDWSALTSLATLHLDANQLNGTLPSTWSGLPVIDKVSLARNELRGPVPLEWNECWPNVTLVNLSHNGISGRLIPERWLTDCSVMVVDLSYNDLRDVAIGSTVAESVLKCAADRRLDLCGNIQLLSVGTVKILMTHSSWSRVAHLLFPGCRAPTLPTATSSMRFTASLPRIGKKSSSLSNLDSSSTSRTSYAQTLTHMLESGTAPLSVSVDTYSLSRLQISASRSPVSISATVPPPLVAYPRPPVASAAAQQATAVAVAASTAVAAVAGPTGAADVQAVAVLLLLSCVPSAQGKQNSYSLLSPVALSDSPAGVVGGNAILCTSLAAVQLVVIALARRFKRLTFPAACAFARFPGALFLSMASLYQGTFVCALALLSSASEGLLFLLLGVAALLWCIALPAVIAAAVMRLPRRFVGYVFRRQVDGGSHRFSRLEALLPVGLVMPNNVRKASLALIAGYAKPSIAFALTPFLSPVVLGLITLLPVTATSTECSGALWISLILHVVLAVSILVLRVHRSLTARISSSAGLLLTGFGHLLIIFGMPSSVTDSFLLAQSALALFRCFVSLGLSLIETMMQNDICRNSPGLTLSTNPMWSVGDGGEQYELEFDSMPQGAGETCLVSGFNEGGEDSRTNDIRPVGESTEEKGEDLSVTQSSPETLVAAREQQLLQRHDKRVCDEAVHRHAERLHQLFDILLHHARALACVSQHREQPCEPLLTQQRVCSTLRVILDCIAAERQARQAKQRLNRGAATNDARRHEVWSQRSDDRLTSHGFGLFE